MTSRCFWLQRSTEIKSSSIITCEISHFMNHSVKNLYLLVSNSAMRAPAINMNLCWSCVLHNNRLHGNGPVTSASHNPPPTRGKDRRTHRGWTLTVNCSLTDHLSVISDGKIN